MRGYDITIQNTCTWLQINCIKYILTSWILIEWIRIKRRSPELANAKGTCFLPWKWLHDHHTSTQCFHYARSLGLTYCIAMKCAAWGLSLWMRSWHFVRVSEHDVRLRPQMWLMLRRSCKFPNFCPRNKSVALSEFDWSRQACTEMLKSWQLGTLDFITYIHTPYALYCGTNYTSDLRHKHEISPGEIPVGMCLISKTTLSHEVNARPVHHVNMCFFWETRKEK